VILLENRNDHGAILEGGINAKPPSRSFVMITANMHGDNPINDTSIFNFNLGKADKSRTKS
jgi:hypothetical protein